MPWAGCRYNRHLCSPGWRCGSGLELYRAWPRGQCATAGRVATKPRSPGSQPNAFPTGSIACPIPLSLVSMVRSPQMGVKVLRTGQVLSSEALDEHLLRKSLSDPPPRATGPGLVRCGSAQRTQEETASTSRARATRGTLLHLSDASGSPGALVLGNRWCSPLCTTGQNPTRRAMGELRQHRPLWAGSLGKGPLKH